MTSLVRRARFLLASLPSLALLALSGCGDDLVPEVPPLPVSAARAVVVSGDFDATGIVTLVDMSSGAVQTNAAVGAAGADPVIRKFGDELFVINRFGPTGSNVSVLDAATLRVSHQLSTGSNSNPQDVAVIGDRLFLPALDTRGVIELQRNGQYSLIDLSSLDPDGKPDCASIYAVDDQLVVVCGLLDGFRAVRDGVVVLYNPTDRSVRTSSLGARNPTGFLQPTPPSSAFGGDLLMATADYGDATAQCVVRIDPRTGASRCAISNADLGGIANHLEVDAAKNVLYVAPTYYEGFVLRGALRTVSLATGAVDAVQSAATQAISDLAVCPDGAVIAADGTFGASGLRIFRDGVERTTAPLSIGLPPVPQNGIVCY